MFGIIRPCRNRLSDGLRESWLAHLCGLCLALRDDHGHLSRVVTNYDGLVISALVEAQGASGRRAAGPCALRGMRSADVAQGAGARLAATASLVLASAKVRDHVDDREGVFSRAPKTGRRLAERWAAQGARTGADIGFDISAMIDAVGRQSAVESAAGLGSSVLLVTEPTETAGAAAFAQAAILAGRPENVAPLHEVGRLFGRVALLIDAVEDLDDGTWNPLTATGTSVAEARRLCDDAALGIKLAMREATFVNGKLVHVLLAHEVEQAIIRAFGSPSAPPEKPSKSDPGSGLWAWPRLNHQAEPRGCFTGCVAFLYMCGTCQFCCRDPFPGPWSDKRRGGLCDCDCSGCNGCDGCHGCDCCCCPCDGC